MAIGARQRDILTQFLLEAVMISFAGCLLGLLLGWASRWRQCLYRHGHRHFRQLGADRLCRGAGVGIFFGWYPAQKPPGSTLSRLCVTNDQSSPFLTSAGLFALLHLALPTTGGSSSSAVAGAVWRLPAICAELAPALEVTLAGRPPARPCPSP